MVHARPDTGLQGHPAPRTRATEATLYTSCILPSRAWVSVVFRREVVFLEVVTVVVCYK